MLGGKRRVEQDLARIRMANLPEGICAPEPREEPEPKAREKISLREIAAMTFAVFSLLAPYVLAFVAIMWIIFKLLV